MKRFIAVAALGLTSISCSSSSPSSPSTSKPTFNVSMLPANETPAVTNVESTSSGNAVITFDTTKDTGGNITSATATFVVNVTGLQASSSVIAAHIHTGAAGVAGSVLVSTNLMASDVTLTNGAGSFTKAAISMTPSVAQGILDNPAGYYFNVHTALNPGGVMRGQLVRAQ